MNRWLKEASHEDLYASEVHSGLGAGESVKTQLGDGCSEPKMKHNKTELYKGGSSRIEQLIRSSIPFF